ILLRETLDRPDALRAMLRRIVRPWLSTVAEYVRVGREGGRHHADVDEEAYVLHMVQLVVMATACGPVTSTVLDDRDPRARYDRALVRVARSSLFAPAADGPPEGGRPL